MIRADRATRELPLLVHADRPVHPVVDEDDDDRQLVLDCGGELRRAHHEVAVACEAEGDPVGVDQLCRDRRGDAVAHRAAARTDLRAVLRELGEPVCPDSEVARSAGLDCVAGEPPAQKRHDLAEIDQPFHGLVTEIRLVVRAGGVRPLQPARLDRLQLPQRGGKLGQVAGDRQVGAVDEAELAWVGVGVHERLPRVRHLEERVAASRHLSQPATEREDEVGLAEPGCKPVVHRDAEDAGVRAGPVVDEVLAAERARNRQPVRLAEGEHVLPRLARPAALADDHQRPLGRRKQLAQPRQDPRRSATRELGERVLRPRRAPPRGRTSSGSASTTGPGRPESASKKAALQVLGQAIGPIGVPRRLGEAAEGACVVDLLPGVTALERSRHMPDEQDQRRRVLHRGMHADRRRVAPGPRVTRQIPGRPVSLPYASAAFAAPCSCRQETSRIDES